MSVATTECPRLASSFAVAIPMPGAAPVIKIFTPFVIRKSSSMILVSSYVLTFQSVMRIARVKPLKGFETKDQTRSEDIHLLPW
jgi:hypothetical protein